MVYLESGKNAIKDSSFVGKWKSSKLETPLYLYDNGEWEIKKNDGAILQYGVWRYEGKKIIWSFKAGSDIIHDVNPVLFFSSNEFQLKEKDGTITVFKKLE
jgi:hypothetical protein